MLVLSGSNFPSTAADLTAAVTGGFAMFFDLPPGGQIAKINGEHPHFADAQINLTNADVTGKKLPPEPKGVGQPVPGFDIGRLTILGTPILLRGTPLTLNIAADAVAFDYDRDSAGRPMLVLRDCRNGELAASITKKDVESLILSGAREGAGAHGISVSDLNLQWSQLGPRSLGVAVSVTARKLVKAQVTVIGRMDIDDKMNAVLSGLECNGSGMIAGLACAAIRPKLQQVEGKSLNLGVLTGGQVPLRDVQITVGDALVVKARFGG